MQKAEQAASKYLELADASALAWMAVLGRLNKNGCFW
jgi:hypothetical protein